MTFDFLTGESLVKPLRKSIVYERQWKPRCRPTTLSPSELGRTEEQEIEVIQPQVALVAARVGAMLLTLISRLSATSVLPKAAEFDGFLRGVQERDVL